MKLAKLPKPPPWKSKVVAVEGGTTKEPLRLFFREGLEVFKFLFANPLFAEHFNTVPTKVWADLNKENQLFGDGMEGLRAWEIQVRYRLI